MNESNGRKKRPRGDARIHTENKKSMKMRKSLKRKNERMNKEKRQIQKLNGGPYQGSRAIASKRLTSGRLKPKQHEEGMFMKGLRTRYVKRNPAYDANEARRKEDINRIIDLGQAINAGIPATDTESCSCPEVQDERSSEDGKFFFIFGKKNESTRRNLMDFENCNLSPISFFKSSSPETEGIEEEEEKSSPSSGAYARSREKKDEHKFEIDFEKEFKEFAAGLEDYSGSEILSKLNKEGVLERAMESLRCLYVSQSTKAEMESSESDETRTDFECENVGCDRYESSRELVKNEIRSPPLNRFLCGEAVRENELPGSREIMPFINTSPVQGVSGMNFMEFFTDGRFENSSYSPSCCISGNDREEVSIGDRIKESQKIDDQVKELCFDTPPRQFYRRNMF